MTSDNEGSNGSFKCNTHNSTKTSSAIEVERAKSTLTFKEIIAPGHMVELELRRILAGPIQSEYQKVEILETYFGKVLLDCVLNFWVFQLYVLLTRRFCLLTDISNRWQDSKYTIR
jgi:hypothetical protein